MAEKNLETQIVLHIPKGRVLTLLSSQSFAEYLESQRCQGKWKEFEHLPLLKVITSDGESIVFDKISDFPVTGIKNVIEFAGKSKALGKARLWLKPIEPVREEKVVKPNAGGAGSI